MQNQKRLKIAQPQTDSLRLLGIGAKPQQAEIHSCREKGAGVILSICITDALLAILVPNLVQTWLYQKIRYTKSVEELANSRTFYIEIWYNGFGDRAENSPPVKPVVNFLV